MPGYSTLMRMASFHPDHMIQTKKQRLMIKNETTFLIFKHLYEIARNKYFLFLSNSKTKATGS